MIHKVKDFGSTPAARLNYALGGKGHEHKIGKVEFIPGTMISEPTPIEKSLPDFNDSIEDEMDLDDPASTQNSEFATSGNFSATTDSANGSAVKTDDAARAFDWRDLNDEFEATASMHCGRGEKLHAHYIVSLAPGERLSNGDWQDVITEYMTAMGYGEATKYCGVIHNDTANQHCHIIACRVKLEHGGPLVDDSNDYAKGMEAMRKLENMYNLQRVANPEDSWGIDIKKEEFRYLGGDRQSALQAQQNGPKRDWAAVIRARINKVWGQQKPRDMGELVRSLEAAGVSVKVRTNKAGAPQGISYKAHGSDIWIAGSKIKATRLTWNNLTEKEGITYCPVRHNEALGLPVPADKSIFRKDVYQLLNRRQAYVIQRTRLRVRVYRKGSDYYAGFGFEQLLKSGKEKQEEWFNDQMFRLVEAIIDLLFGTKRGRAAPPIITEFGDVPEGLEHVKGEQGYDCEYELAEASVLSVKQLKEIPKERSDVIYKTHAEWIRPGTIIIGSSLEKEAALEK